MCTLNLDRSRSCDLPCSCNLIAHAILSRKARDCTKVRQKESDYKECRNQGRCSSSCLPGFLIKSFDLSILCPAPASLNPCRCRRGGSAADPAQIVAVEQIGLAVLAQRRGEVARAKVGRPDAAAFHCVPSAADATSVMKNTSSETMCTTNPDRSPLMRPSLLMQSSLLMQHSRASGVTAPKSDKNNLIIMNAGIKEGALISCFPGFLINSFDLFLSPPPRSLEPVSL